MLAQELLGLVGQPGEVLQDGVDGELLGVRMLKIGYPRARAMAKRIVMPILVRACGAAPAVGS
jgi:hypothetical protein